MARKIHCAGCGTYLGELRDATLRIDVSHLCKKMRDGAGSDGFVAAGWNEGHGG